MIYNIYITIYTYIKCHKWFACWTQALNKTKWQHKSLQPRLASKQKHPLHAACPLAISSSSPAKNSHKRHVIKKPETSPR